MCYISVPINFMNALPSPPFPSLLGAVPLGDIANMFDKSTLQELKSECGGMQTLLRNHSHIFQGDLRDCKLFLTVVHFLNHSLSLDKCGILVLGGLICTNNDTG